MKPFLRLAQILVLISLNSAASAQVSWDADELTQLITVQNSQIHRRIDSRTGVGVGALAPNDPLRTMVRQRAEYLKKLIEADPGRALTLRLSDDVRRRLLAQSSDLKDTVEEFGSWNGPAEVLIEDRFDLGTSRTLVRVRDQSGELDVFFERAVPDLVCRQHVDVQGMRIGDVIAASAATAGEMRAHEKGVQVGCESTVGTHNIVVVLIQFPGDPLPGFVTQDWVQDRMFSTVERSLHGFWAENSSGLAGAVGDMDDVYGPIEIAATCSPTAIRNAAVAAVDGNVDFSNYTRLFIIFPESACGFLGLGSVGCSSVSTNDCGGSSCPMGVSWMTIDSNNDNRSYLAAFGSHEGGHNYRLLHASSFEYGNQPLGDLDDDGVLCEYGDVFSTMGVLYGSNPITGHYSAQHKAQLGWLSLGSGYQEVDSPGTFVLQPAETSSGLRGLRILRDPGSDLWLWLEYRQPLGDYDPRVFLFSSSAFSGALAHYQYLGLPGGPFLDDGRTRLLDFQPGFPTAMPDNQCVGSIGSDDMREVTLLPGVLWTDPDPNSELSLLVNSADSNGLSVTVSYGGIPINEPPTADSVTPSSGSGPGGVFSYTISDPNGFEDIKWYYVRFNVDLAQADSCYVWYSPFADQLFLRDDAGGSWLGPLTPGSPGTLENSRCSLNAGNSSTVKAGASVTLNLDLQFHQSGPKTTWLRGTDTALQSSGWVPVGTWTVTGNPNQPPTADSVTPSSGSGPGGVFSYTISDPNGFQDIRWYYVRFNVDLAQADSCYVWYSPFADQLFLRDDAGASWLGPLTPGSPGTLENFRCSLNAGNSSTVKAGASLTLNLDLQFHQSGPKTTWLRGTDTAFQSSGWVAVGTWTATGNPNQPPTADSVTPSSGSGPGGVFSYTISDPNGFEDIRWYYVRFNVDLAQANSCYVWYSPFADQLFLRDDAGAS